MGYKDFENFDGANGEHQENIITLDGSAPRIDLPDSSYIKDAELSRDGMDLILDGSQGQIVIDGYFAQIDSPVLHAPDGSSLNANLVNSFVKSSPLYADAGSMSDESPVGAVHEVTGGATVTRTDGSSETIELGTPIYQGDIIETADNGAVNVMFVDESSFAVSEDARLAIDEYVFDPSSSEGATDFSVLKGVFVYTSGLIGREDPDDVNIETPVGSIGIRGTIIAGDVNAGEITVVEGAIVLRDGMGNEMTLANQFETAQFDTVNGTINNMGQMSASDVAGKFSSVSGVAAQLFSSINDTAQEQSADGETQAQTVESTDNGETLQEQNLDSNNDGTVDGTVDENGDGEADGTVEGAQDGEAENAEGTEAASDEQSDASDATQDGETTTQNASANDGTTGDTSTQEPAPAPIQTTTSTNGGLGSTATKSGTTSTSSSGETTTNTTTTAKATTTTTQTTTSSQTRTTETTRPTETDPAVTETATVTQPTVTPFVISAAVEPDIFENTASIKIATLSGDQLDTANVSLLGAYGDLFDVVASGTVTDIYLKSGVDLDYESTPSLTVDYSALSLNGTDSYNGSFTVNVVDLDDPAVFTSYNATNPDAQTAADQIWSYNFSQHAFDEDVVDTPEIDVVIRDDGGNVVFDSLSGDIYLDSGEPDIGAMKLDSINFSGGTLTIDVQNILSADRYLDIDIYMDGAFQETVNLDYYNPAGTLIDGDTNDITGGNYSINSAIGSGATITGNGGKAIFSDLDDLGIEIQSISSTINTGGGADILSIEGGSGNDVSAGTGNDFITIKEASNFVYGQAGNDTISINFEAYEIWSDYETITSATAKIDGGMNSALNPFYINFEQTFANSLNARTYNGHGDILKIEDDSGFGHNNAGDLIDFTAMVNDVIKNIEILDIDNTDNNHVVLNTTDIFDMTDHNDTLVIRGDTNDSLDFDTLSNGYTDGGTITDDATGDTYNVYFSEGADVTLLVDTDIATTIDGVAV